MHCPYHVTHVDSGFDRTKLAALLASATAMLDVGVPFFLSDPRVRLNALIMLNDVVCIRDTPPQEAVEVLARAFKLLYGGDVASIGGVRPVDASALKYDTNTPLWCLDGPLTFSHKAAFQSLARACVELGQTWDHVQAKAAAARKTGWAKWARREKKLAARKAAAKAAAKTTK